MLVARHIGCVEHRFVILLIFILLVPTSAVGELTGGDNPEFNRAIGYWLDYDDENSLPRLAELARAGNIAARLLLARIERYDRAPSVYIQRLDREQRLRLFRRPDDNGPFYRSWIEVEADNGHPLAIALAKSRMPNVDIGLIKQLKLLGEEQATDHLVRIASIYGNAEVHSALLINGVAPRELRPYVLSFRSPPEKLSDGIEALREIVSTDPSMDAGGVNSSDPDTSNVARLLSLGAPFGNVGASSRWRPVIERWLMTAQATKPIADICRRECPEEASSCAITLLGLTGGYYEVIRLDSPLENAISQPEFLNSERARRMALRRAALILSETAGELLTFEQITAQSSCTSAIIQRERKAR